MTVIVGYVGSAPLNSVQQLIAAMTVDGGQHSQRLKPHVGLLIQDESSHDVNFDHWLVAGHALHHEFDRSPAPDGAYAAVRWDANRETLTMVRDPFGIQAIYHITIHNIFYFSTSLRVLAAIPEFERRIDPIAIHRYLVFGFVPNERMPLAGVSRTPPGSRVKFHAGTITVELGDPLRETAREDLGEFATAIPEVEAALELATTRRVIDHSRVGLYLSGGLDSSAIAVMLKRIGVPIQAFTLDFGPASVEREDAQMIASHLEIPLEIVPVDGDRIRAILPQLVRGLELPFGDSVTGPQWLLGQAARSHGLRDVFNGEGGDQLFGGWTNKPMIAAQMYAAEPREETYLRSFHRFQGLEAELYTPEFLSQISDTLDCRPLLTPFVHSPYANSFLHRMRLTDIALKGSYNILPRMQAIANALGLRIHAPLFDRRLAELAFAIPPTMKLNGAAEKVILRQMLQTYLPVSIIQRRKTGMCVPMTEWMLTAPPDWLDGVLGRNGLLRRGIFRPAMIERLCQGINEPNEIRRRRVGERLWTLVMLEMWMRTFVDR